MCFLDPNAISPNAWYLVMPLSFSLGVSIEEDWHGYEPPGCSREPYPSSLLPTAQWIWGSGLHSEAKAGKDVEDLMQDSDLFCYLNFFKQLLSEMRETVYFGHMGN